MQERHEEREEQLPLVEVAPEDHEGPLDVAPPHGGDDVPVEVHAHRRPGEHHLVHHDLEPEGLVDDEHHAPDAHHGQGRPVEPGEAAGAHPRQVLPVGAPERPDEQRKRGQDAPVAGLRGEQQGHPVGDQKEPRRRAERG